jgi:hypothetical protein
MESELRFRSEMFGTKAKESKIESNMMEKRPRGP